MARVRLRGALGVQPEAAQSGRTLALGPATRQPEALGRLVPSDSESKDTQVRPWGSFFPSLRQLHPHPTQGSRHPPHTWPFWTHRSPGARAQGAGGGGGPTPGPARSLWPSKRSRAAAGGGRPLDEDRASLFGASAGSACLGEQGGDTQSGLRASGGGGGDGGSSDCSPSSMGHGPEPSGSRNPAAASRKWKGQRLIGFHFGRRVP